VRYLESRQVGSGGFAEPGRVATPGVTAWAALGLRAAGASPGAATARYLAARGFDADAIESVLRGHGVAGDA
jgi:hypothetical protein